MFEQLIPVLDFIFSPLMIFPPTISLFLLAFIVTALIILINKIFVRGNVLKELKARMEQMREELIRYQKDGNSEKANEILGQIAQTNLVYMKHTFKALFISLIIVILVFPWMQATYKDITVAELPLAVPFVGTSLNWFIWYFIASLAIGWVVRKLMGLDYG